MFVERSICRIFSVTFSCIMVVLSFLHYDNALYPHIIHNISDIVVFKSSTTQLTFTCSKSAIETLEKDLKYVKKNKKNTRTTSTSFCWFYC